MVVPHDKLIFHIFQIIWVYSLDNLLPMTPHKTNLESFSQETMLSPDNTFIPVQFLQNDHSRACYISWVVRHTSSPTSRCVVRFPPVEKKSTKALSVCAVLRCKLDLNMYQTLQINWDWLYRISWKPGDVCSSKLPLKKNC